MKFHDSSSKKMLCMWLLTFFSVVMSFSGIQSMRAEGPAENQLAPIVLPEGYVREVSKADTKTEAQQDAKTIKLCIVDRNFAKLEEITSEFRKTNAKYRDGSSRLWECYFVLKEYLDEPVYLDVYLERQKIADEYLEKFHDSTTAYMLKVISLYTTGHRLKSTEFSKDQEDQHKKGEEYYQQAQIIMDKLAPRQQAHDVAYFYNKLNLLNLRENQEERIPLMFDVVVEALRSDPYNMEVTRTFGYMAGYNSSLEKKIDAVSYANRLSEISRGLVGELHYARLANSMFMNDQDCLLDQQHFDWKKVRQGFEDWRKLYPEANELVDEFAVMSIHARDYAFAASLFPLMNPDLKSTVMDNNIHLQELKNHCEAKNFEGEQQKLIHSHIYLIKRKFISPDCKQMLIVNKNNTFRVVNLDTGESPFCERIEDCTASSVDVNWNRKEIIYVNNNSDRLIILNYETRKLMSHDWLNLKVKKIVCFADNKRILVEHKTAEGNVLSVVDLEKKIIAPSYMTTREFLAMRLSPDNNNLAATLGSGDLMIFDVKSMKEQATIKINNARTFQLEWSGDSKMIVVGSNNTEVKIWSWPEKKLIAQTRFEAGEIGAVGFSPDQNMLAIGLQKLGNQGMYADPLYIWKFRTKEPPVNFKGHQYGIGDIAWKSDQEVITLGYDWTARFWKVP